VAPSTLNPDPIVRALQGAFCRDVSREELLQLAASRIRKAGPPYAGVSLYVGHGDSATLAAADGPPPDPSFHPESDLVVLIRRHEEILGRIQIHGGVADSFDNAEEAAVRQVADALAVLL
jgi:hypothetical protein